VLRALVALPLQFVVVWRAAVGRSAKTGDPCSRFAKRNRAAAVGRAMIGLPVALGATVSALVLLFALARAIYYPFWAAGASREALGRSWGGPSAIGATLVHWLVAAVSIVVVYAVILVMERLARAAPPPS
jgi:hypothetical protein